MAKILIEGQEIDLEDEIANNDEMLKAALKPAWPDAANATFARKTDGGVLKVTVTKKAGTKGASLPPEIASAIESIKRVMAGPTSRANRSTLADALFKLIEDAPDDWVGAALKLVLSDGVLHDEAIRIGAIT